MPGLGGMAGIGGMGGFGGMGGTGGSSGAAGAQAFFSVSSETMFAGDPPPVFNYQEHLAERRAFRAAQAEQRQQRLAMRKVKRSRAERISSDGG
jgi:hypothetical protein